jgi:hypothetical protein
VDGRYHPSVAENLYRASAKPPPPPDPYLLAWGRLRTRRKITHGGFLGAFAGFAATTLTAAHGSSASVLLAGFVLSASFVAVASMWGTLVVFFLCPHCQNYFAFRNAFGPGPLAPRRCSNCGIAMGTPRSAVERTQPIEQAAPVEQSPSFSGEPRDDSERDLPDARSGSGSA